MWSVALAAKNHQTHHVEVFGPFVGDSGLAYYSLASDGLLAGLRAAMSANSMSCLEPIVLPAKTTQRVGNSASDCVG